MAAPNLKSPTTITGKTVAYNCTTSLASVLSNGGSSGKVLKINTIRAANLTTTGVSVDVTLYRGSTHYYIVDAATAPPYSSLVILNKEEYFYLEEGDAIYAKSSAGTSVDLILNYEEIS